MRRTAAVVLGMALVGSLAGCTSSAPEPNGSSATPPSASPSPSPTIATVHLPPRTSTEVLRSTVTGSGVVERAADSHGVRAYTVDVACSGSAGSTLGWTLEDGGGHLIIGSTADCTGTSEGADWTSPGPPPASLQLALAPHGVVEAGYAVLSRR